MGRKVACYCSGMKLRGKDKGKPLEAKASGDHNLNFNQLTYNCLYLIGLQYLIFSLRWQEEVGRSWAKPEDDCQKSSPLITIIKFSIF